MRMYDMIEKKKRGGVLSREEIAWAPVDATRYMGEQRPFNAAHCAKDILCERD